MNWYYSENNEQKGPVDRETLEKMARKGDLYPTQLVWTEEFGEEWKEARFVPGLFQSATSKPTGATAPASLEQIPAYGSSASIEVVDGFAPNRVLTARARRNLKGNWAVGVVVFLLHMIITQAISNLVPVMGPFITFFLSAPLAVGLAIVFLNIGRGKTAEVGQLFSGFPMLWNSIGVYLLSTIFVILWMLLLIIPGIIAALAYSQVYYLIADHPNLSPSDAIASSKTLMKGHKWQYFCLGFRFIGWFLLSALTLFIGLLWLIPYMQAAYAEFYLELRKEQKRNEAAAGR